jgi:purine-binding chemotaxis protein CheW
LAGPSTPDPATSSIRAICFWLGGQQIAVDMADVKETIVLRPITRVFLTPPCVAGLINLRGDVVAVLNLDALLGLTGGLVGADARIVIVRRDGRSAGLLVDRLAEPRSIDPEAIHPAPPTVAPEAAALLGGVVTLEGGAPLLVLDLPKLFGCDRLRQFRRKA